MGWLSSSFIRAMTWSKAVSGPEPRISLRKGISASAQRVKNGLFENTASRSPLALEDVIKAGVTDDDA